METVYICSVGIYGCEESSAIKINMNMTHNFDILHSDYLWLFQIEVRRWTNIGPTLGQCLVFAGMLF